jgi:biotin/methionine sulfoxide reductase
MTVLEQLLPTATHWGTYLARVRAGTVIGIESHPRDPDPSPIGPGMVEALTSTARVRVPMVREGYLARGPRHGGNSRGAEPFVAVSWDEALDLAAEALSRVKEQHGNHAIYGGAYGWASAGRFHHSQGQLHRFLNLFGGYTDHVNSYSYGALEVIMPHVLGDTLRFRADIPTWRDIAAHTQLFIGFGGVPLRNTQVNAGGVLRHSAREDIRACRDAGVAFVNVGPVRDDMSTELGAEWISIRPGTDVAFMLGLAHVLISDNQVDTDFITRCCVGYAPFRDYVVGLSDGVPKTPVWAANICDCRAEQIVALAQRISRQRTLISMQWAVQRADRGEQPCWMATVLAAISGSMGKPGGGLGFGYGSVHGYASGTARLKVAAFPQGTNPIKTFFPVARLADVLLNPGAPMPYNGQTLRCPDIRLIYWCGGNPFHHHQDINKLLRAWQQPETIIVHEPFWTSTARHADIVFPATTPLERDDIAFGDGTLVAAHQILPPVGEAQSDYAIFSGIAARLGFERAFAQGRSEQEWIALLYAETRALAAAAGVALPDYETFRGLGTITLPETPRPGALLGAFREDPDGHPLATPSGRVEIFSDTIASFEYADCPGHPVWLEPPEWLGNGDGRYPIHVLSSQPATRLHSQYDNGGYSRASKVHGREPIRLHPADAAARGIADGDVVRVFNGRGAFLAGAVLTDALRPGVAQIATGAWYDPLEPGTPGSLDVHGNPNMVAPDRGTSSLAQGSSAMSAMVQIEKFTGALPAVKVFDPPPTVSGSGKKAGRGTSMSGSAGD